LRLHERELRESGYGRLEREHNAVPGGQERLPLPLIGAMAEVRWELDLAEQKTEPGQPERAVDPVLRIADPPLPLLYRECGVRPEVAIDRVSGESELPLNLFDILPL
jgi:hypothetical protein